jgi:hypothetical protein
MTKQAKEYKDKVIECLMQKYGMVEIEAVRAIRNSYLQDSLNIYPEETIHDDIEHNADNVFHDYTHPQLMQM